MPLFPTFPPIYYTLLVLSIFAANRYMNGVNMFMG